MIPRRLEPQLRKAATQYPVVTVTGPRQSGKTTLCRAVFPEHPYVNLEPLDVRAFAVDDPRGFLAQFPDGAVLDEVQNAPDLASYLQEIVDADPRPGRFILTGSQHFALSDRVAQSLAGRTAIMHLLPLSWDELSESEAAPPTLPQALFAGGFPRIFDRGIPPSEWLSDYVATYVQRDVRQVLNVGELTTFTTFIRLAAGRTSAELNLSELGSDAGVSHNTARAWLSVLETSFLGFRLPAFHGNLRKRLVKAPKFHFMDSGLVSHLLGISSADQLVTHPLRGAVFESWVASEIYKARVHRRLEPWMSHVRVARGPEVDVVVEAGDRIFAVEAKSGATAKSGFWEQLHAFDALIASGGDARPVLKRVVYGGDADQRRSDGELLSWRSIQTADWC